MRESDGDGGGEGGQQNVEDMGKGVGDGRAGCQGRREKEKPGRDDNLNDRKVGCRNAPKLAITGWRGDNGG